MSSYCIHVSVAEIGDITRFKSYRHLSSYAGFIPNSHQSGEKDPKGRLTYRSNKYIRSMLVEAAWVAMRHDPALLKYYRERIAGKESKYIIIKVAHKLLNGVRQVWISQIHIKPDWHNIKPCIRRPAQNSVCGQNMNPQL